MTQQNNPCKDDMTALRFRDSPQDILLRPSTGARGNGVAHLRRAALLRPRFPPDLRTRLMLCATSITTASYYTEPENLVKS